MYSLPSREGRIQEAHKSSDSLDLRLTCQVYTDRPFEIWGIFNEIERNKDNKLYDLNMKCFSQTHVFDTCVGVCVGGNFRRHSLSGGSGSPRCLSCSCLWCLTWANPLPLSASWLPRGRGSILPLPPCQDRLKALSSWAQMNFSSFEVVSIRPLVTVTQNDCPRKNDKITFKLSMRMCLEIRTIFGKYDVKSI